MNLRSELEGARVARARNRTKCRGTEAAIKITERRHIRKFEYLGSKLEVYSLGDSEDFPEHQVGILQYGDTLFTHIRTNRDQSSVASQALKQGVAISRLLSSLLQMQCRPARVNPGPGFR